MKLHSLRDEREGDTRTISMDLEWEESGRPGQTLYFSAAGQVAELLHPSPNPFALACMPMVAWSGELRMQVEGSLCTRYRAGLNAVNQVYAEWFDHASLISVEPTQGYVPTMPPVHRRVASLLSGGVDGLASLRQNRLDYPLNHPESIQACISLFGVNTYDHDDDGPVAERLEAFEELQNRLQGLAVAEHFELLPVRTNVRSLAWDYEAWIAVGFGAGHIAVSQLFQGAFDKVLYASDGEGPNPHAGPLHPLVNQWFSSNAVVIQSDQDEMTRTEKVALLADWDQGRRLMQPCHYIRIPEQGRINCGQCEKCVRTMLALIGLGRLDEVSAFAGMDVSARDIHRIPVKNVRKAKLLLQPVPLLQDAGRMDLVWAIRRRIWKFRLTGG